MTAKEKFKKAWNSWLKVTTAFVVMAVLLVVMAFCSTLIGGISVSVADIFKGIFVEYNRDVAIVVELRFPRICVSILAGAAMAVSGVLLQAVMRNPLADPGIIGISSSSAFFAVLVTALLPAISFLAPVFSFVGGLLAFIIVYVLAIKGGMSSTRLILIGLAVSTFFTALSTAFGQLTGGSSFAQSIVDGIIKSKTWDDVLVMAISVAVGAVLCIFCVKRCNLLSLSDRLAGSIGINVPRSRFAISAVAVLLSAASTAIVGAVSFLGLIVPHIARLLVGNDHRKLIPYSAILGAFVFLTADTLGRWIAYPYEISASILMAVVGGPVFIVLLLRSKKYA
ncbi:MAG: iron ABC transporter permease [Clostridia bacterium]|nr:iron ABC transporter permease [Clostridia bacterium]